jgi:hypothetical protein
MMLLGFGAGACSSGGGGSAAGLCSLVKSDNRNLKNATTAQAASALKALAAKAPGAIKGDLQTLSDFVSSASSGNLPSAADTKKAETASTNIEKYVKDKCNIDLNSGATPGAASSSVPGS